MSFVISILIAAVDGFARYFDGKGIPHGETWIRNIYLIAAALLAGWWGIGLDWWVLAFAAAGGLAFIPGSPDWKDAKMMALWYGGIPAVPAALYVLFGGNELVLLWPVAAALVGFTYYRVLKGLVNKGRLPQNADEFIAGAVILGGPAFF